MFWRKHKEEQQKLKAMFIAERNRKDNLIAESELHLLETDDSELAIMLYKQNQRLLSALRSIQDALDIFETPEV